MSRIGNLLIGACMLAGIVCFGAPRAKFIDLSWSNPTISFLEKNLSAMEEQAPVDGLTVRFSGRRVERNGQEYTPGEGDMWNRHPWQYEDFTDAIRRYKTLKFKKFTDNFFYVTTSHIAMDWFSDSDWKTIAEHGRIAARIVRETGMKGMLVDVEEYGTPIWDYEDFNNGKSHAEFDEMLFQRGRQWGEAVFAEYPDMILFMPYCLSMMQGFMVRKFVNGLIAAMPPTARIYEGYEIFSYHAHTQEAYDEMCGRMNQLFREHVRPELQAKARAQVLYSPGFYLDAIFCNNPSFSYHQALQPQLGRLGAQVFFRNQLMAAMNQADPYIWIYGEKRAWWHGFEHPRAEGRWQDYPGVKNLVGVMDMLKDPAGIVPDLSQNLVPAGDFKGQTTVWDFWQREDEQKAKGPGKGYVQDGKAVLKTVKQGCLNQLIPVRGGECYLFQCKGGFAPGKVAGTVSAALCFKEGEVWMRPWTYVRLTLEPQEGEQVLSAILQVPTTATSVSVQCAASNQGNNGEAYFTQIHLQEIK